MGNFSRAVIVTAVLAAGGCGEVPSQHAEVMQAIAPATTPKEPFLERAAGADVDKTIQKTINETRVETPETTTTMPRAVNARVGGMVVGVYCGPTVLDLTPEYQSVTEGILRGMHVNEIHPGCGSPYGRISTGEHRQEAGLGLSNIDYNKAQLDMAKLVDAKYFVDDDRLLSGDAEQVRAALDDYDAYFRDSPKNIGIEVYDEASDDVVRQTIAALKLVEPELKLRYGIDIRDMVRPNFNGEGDNFSTSLGLYVEYLGADAQYAVDAYRLDRGFWDYVAKTFKDQGVSNWVLAAPITEWGNAKIQGVFDSPKASAEYLQAFIDTALSYAADGCKGIFFFTGFEPTWPNIYGQSFRYNWSATDTSKMPDWYAGIPAQIEQQIATYNAKKAALATTAISKAGGA